MHEVDGLRIIALDTSVPGYHHGELTDDQLGWLRDQLATPAPHGTLLALHHPPIPVPMLRAAEIIELDDQHRLAEVLEGSDVRAILGGHFHFTSWSTFAGIPVSVASASCYTSDPAPLARFVSGVDGHQAITMLHLYDDRVVNSVVPLAPAPEVSGYPSDVIAQVEALSHEERRGPAVAQGLPLQPGRGEGERRPRGLTVRSPRAAPRSRTRLPPARAASAGRSCSSVLLSSGQDVAALHDDVDRLQWRRGGSLDRLPVSASKTLMWQGQMIRPSVTSATGQPWWVHVAENA